jgi:hypothetical protein
MKDKEGEERKKGRKKYVAEYIQLFKSSKITEPFCESDKVPCPEATGDRVGDNVPAGRTQEL